MQQRENSEAYELEMETLERGVILQAEQKNLAKFRINPRQLTVGTGKVVALSVACLY
jgi:hypothetical protein